VIRLSLSLIIYYDLEKHESFYYNFARLSLSLAFAILIFPFVFDLLLIKRSDFDVLNYIIQTMEQLLGGRAGRGKPSAYAAMIKELLHEVEKLSHDNESLKKELSEAKARDGAASERVGALAKERDSLESSLKSQQEQASNKEIMMALEMANKENEISRLHRANTDLNDQIAKLKEEWN
jgi:hypothetical protein